MLSLICRHAVIANRWDDAVIEIQDAVTVALDPILVQVVFFAAFITREVINFFLLDDLAPLVLLFDFVKLLFALRACVPFLRPVVDAVEAVFVLAAVDVRGLLWNF